MVSTNKPLINFTGALWNQRLCWRFMLCDFCYFWRKVRRRLYHSYIWPSSSDHGCQMYQSYVFLPNTYIVSLKYVVSRLHPFHTLFLPISILTLYFTRTSSYIVVDWAVLLLLPLAVLFLFSEVLVVFLTPPGECCNSALKCPTSVSFHLIYI